MLRTRIIPCLQLIDNALVKAVKFEKPMYIGDPVNTVRIFNELEVDELCFLDIRATIENRSPDLEILSNIASECFMPLSYGGGVRDLHTAKKILSIGFEKIVLNSSAYFTPELVTEIADYSGNQSVIGSIDVKKNMFGKYAVYVNDGNKKTEMNPIEWAQKLEYLGVGELFITSMNNEGTWNGFDVEIIRKISDAVKVPVIANGGGGSLGHIQDVIVNGKASAVALGSMLVYQKKGMGVLINYPDKKELAKILE